MSRAWIPLLGIGVAYVGFLVGVGIIALVTPKEYEHASGLHWGLIVLAWGLLALVSIAVSIGSLALTYKQLRRWVRWMTVALSVPVAITVAAGLQLSISASRTTRPG